LDVGTASKDAVGHKDVEEISEEGDDEDKPMDK